METLKPKSSSINDKSKKFAKTFQKVIGLRTATKIASNNGICLLATHGRFNEDDTFSGQNNQKKNEDNNNNNRARNRAVMEALIARLFAGVTAIKASYAELQIAQNPYNNEAIQASDQAIVDELRAISELKRGFLKKELDLSPQVTLMLAEIQEQQSIMKTYEITIKKLESEAEHKQQNIAALKNQLHDCLAFNKSLEKKLNSSGALSLFENLHFSALSHTHFVQFLHHTVRSVRSFVKLVIKEMNSAHWDLDAAIKFIHPHAVFAKPSHKIFAFESFVCITMFEGFNYPNFIVPSEPFEHNQPHRQSSKLYFDKFKKIKSLNPKQYITQNPHSSFAKFLKFKYLQLIHAKMECSLFKNLNQRKVVTSGGFPDSAFFIAFAEMAKRIWDLHCLAYSFDEEVTVFQVKKNTRFSEVYMECVTEDSVFPSTSTSTADEIDLRVGFTVVPGFKIGKTVIQSQVYLSPASSTARSLTFF